MYIIMWFSINGLKIKSVTVHVFISQALFATYGVDWSGPPPSDVVSNDTVVPDTNCPLTPTEIGRAAVTVQPSWSL